MPAITDKKALYDALARHVIAYPDPNPATGQPWTVSERIDSILQIKAAVDAKLAELDAAAQAAEQAAEAARQAELQKAAAKADAVDGWLAALKQTDPERFEQLRRQPFDDQAAAAQADGVTW